MSLSRTLLALALAASPLAGSAAAAGELPAEARIAYDVLYGDGQFRVGRAEQRWHAESGRYELQTDLVPVLGPRIRYLSTGRLTDRGLVPESFAEYRGSDKTPHSRADFDWAQMQVRYGKGGDLHSAPLERGAQDVNALAFQLAWLGDQARGTVQVTTGKKVGRYSFSSGGRMMVTVNGQRTEVQPWRSTQGADRTEVWVAPQFSNLPVRVVQVDDDKQLQLVARQVTITPAHPPAR
jgi:hypothetical protein